MPEYEKRNDLELLLQQRKKAKICLVKKQHEVVFRLDGKRKTTKQSCCGESSYKKGKGFHKEKTLHKIRQRHRGKISKEREKCLSKKGKNRES